MGLIKLVEQDEAIDAEEVTESVAHRLPIRALGKQGEMLRARRGNQEAANLGEFFVVDLMNAIMCHDVDLETIWRSLEILVAWEVRAD